MSKQKLSSASEGASPGASKARSWIKFTIFPQTRLGWVRLWLLVVLTALGGVGCLTSMVNMPLESHRGPLPPIENDPAPAMPSESYSGALPPLPAETIEIRARLEADVRALCTQMGGRNQLDMAGLRAAEEFIKRSFESAGYAVSFHEYECEGETVRNIEAELRGTSSPEEIVVIGAHYDAHIGQSADDNASGTAGVLELARAFSGKPLLRTVRFLAFVNEEPPYFQVPGKMGSEVYAARCVERGENIVSMLSLEMIGYYTTEEGSQKYPWPLNMIYPSTGDFVAFVGSYGNRALVRECVRAFRTRTPFPSEGAALPRSLPGVDFSDHWSFSYHGFSAAMVTDTAFYRNPHYHERSDTPETLDFDRMARVVSGLRDVVTVLAGGELR